MRGDSAIIRNIFARSQIAGRDGSMALTGGVGNSISPWDGVVRSGPHFGTHYLPGGLALPVFGAWDQITNLFTKTQDFSHPNWTKGQLNGSTPVVVNDIIAPDGTLTACRIVEGNGFGNGNLYQGGFTVSTQYTVAVYAKSNGRHLIISNAGAGTHSVGFNLVSGAIFAQGGSITSASIQPVGLGWWKCACTFTAAYASIGVYINASTSAFASYTGDNSSGVWLWGVQAETGALANLYVASDATQLTRTADSCVWTMPNALTQDEELTVLTWQPYADGDMGIATQTWAECPYPRFIRNIGNSLEADHFNGTTTYSGYITRTLPSRGTLAMQTIRYGSNLIYAGYGGVLGSGVATTPTLQTPSTSRIGSSSTAGRAGRGFGSLICTRGGLAQYERDALARYLHLVLRPAAA